MFKQQEIGRRLRTLKTDGSTVYLCEICGFGYRDAETGSSCKTFCEEHNSCSVEITKKAIYKPES